MASAGCTNSTCTNSTCTNADHGCFSAETFCKTSQKATSYASHSWPASFLKDQIIIKVLPRSVFNSAFSFIKTALRKGNTQATNTTWDYTAETRDFIYADKVNNLLDGLAKFSGGHSIPQAQKNGVIYASYFTSIAQALNNAKLSSSACDYCNTGCEGCVTCEGCNSCEGCNTCRGHRTCHNPCHSPCHNPCDTSA